LPPGLLLAIPPTLLPSVPERTPLARVGSCPPTLIWGCMATGPIPERVSELEATRLPMRALLSCLLACTRRATSSFWVLEVRTLTLSSSLLSKISIAPLLLLFPPPACCAVLLLVPAFAPWILPTEKLSWKGKATFGSTNVFSLVGLEVACRRSQTQSWLSNSATAVISDYVWGEVTVWVAESQVHSLTSCRRT
jgi:hypothetical protein